MDPTSREDLSTLMDGELAAEPTRFLLRRLDHDPELAATWSRWHLIRACLVSDPARMSAAKSDDRFAARVADAVGARSHRYHWARYVGGGAIAAGVAVAALVLSVPGSIDTRPSQPAPAVASNDASAAGTAPAPATPRYARAPVVPPWLLTPQPTALSVQPASANVAYGTGLLRSDYLRPATFDRSTSLTVPPTALMPDRAGAPYAIRMVPEPDATETQPQQH